MERLKEILICLKDEDLYRILELDIKADKQRVKQAYKLKILQYHPDKVKKAEEKLNAPEMLDKVKKAYEVLKNEDLRALYDDMLKRKQEQKEKVKTMNQARKNVKEDLEKREENAKRNINNNSTYNPNNSNSRQYNNDNRTNYHNDLTSIKIEKNVKTFQQKLNDSGLKVNIL